MKRINKDDIILVSLALCLAVAISFPVFFILSINNAKTDTALKSNNDIQQNNAPEKTQENSVADEVTQDISQEKTESTINVVKTTSSTYGKEFYRNTLTTSERIIYDTICENIKNYNTNYFSITPISAEVLKKIYKFITYDHEEFFYFDNITYTSSGNLASAVKINLNSNNDTAKEKKINIDMIVDSIVSQIKDMSEYEKVKFVHDYIIQNTDYVLGSIDNQNICSVFLGKQSVCAGYSRAFQYILRKAGIYCIYVTGTAQNFNDNTPRGHAWNLIKIDGEYYYVDTTFDDPTSTSTNTTINYCSYDNLNITTEELLKDHTVDVDIPELPIAKCTDANYFKKEGLYYSDFNDDTLISMANNIAAHTNEKKEVFSYRFENTNAYSAAVSQLFQTGKKMSTLLMNVNIKPSVSNKLVSNSLSYVLDDSKFIITIFVTYK